MRIVAVIFGMLLVGLLITTHGASPPPEFDRKHGRQIIICDQDLGPDFRLIRDSATALSMGKAIYGVFYGEDSLQSFQARTVGDSVWVITSTIPLGSLGGGVEIHLDARNSQIIYMCHYL